MQRPAKPAKFTAANYATFLRAEQAHLLNLGGTPAGQARTQAGVTDKGRKAPGAPDRSIDQLKDENKRLREELRRRGIEHRSDEQIAADEARSQARRQARSDAIRAERRANDEFYARLRRLEVEERARPGTVTTPMVNLILQLQAKRRRDGEGGGFMTGPTERSEIAAMSFNDASAYIASLKGDY